MFYHNNILKARKKGIVTNVNSTFLCFKLNTEEKVHLSILLTQDPLQKLPKIGSRVVVKNAHCVADSYIACKDSILEGDFTVAYEKSLFLDLVKNFKLGFSDLYEIETIIEEIEINYAALAQTERNNLILKTLKYIIDKLEKRVTFKKHVCLNKRIFYNNIVTVNSCRHIEAMPDTEKFNDFPHWSFGIHAKRLEKYLLFSLIHVCPFYGFLLLSDDKHKVPCKIINATIDEIASIDGTYILVKEYRVVTEIYREKNVPNMEYFLIDFNDINIIHRLEKDHHLFGKYIPLQKTFKISMHFQIIRKSTVCVGNTGSRETWLQILVKNQGTAPSESYLILTAQYIKIVVYLEEGHHYKLLYNNTLKETENWELARLKKLKTYRLQEEDAFFLKLNEATAPRNYLTVEQCKNHVLNHTDMVSFEGVLKGKRFSDLLPSRTKKRTRTYGFGTPGSKVHQLDFSYEENNKTVYLDCYLNNWDNFELPLGLIPQMKIIVRNVIPQSKKYLKSSVFTTFEIVAYEPALEFETVNLYKYDNIDWGRESHLGHGNQIPYGVMLWGKVSNIQVLSVKFNVHCAKCKFNLDYSGPCGRCRSTESSTDFLAKMHVSDGFGQSKILAKHIGIMKALLGMHENGFKGWLDAFTQLWHYEYNMFEETDVSDNVLERHVLKKDVTNKLRALNKLNMVFFKFKCRKLDSSPLRNRGRPLWFCVDAVRC